MGVLIVCFWGVIFPLISELVTGQKVTVGPPFYHACQWPLFGALMALMGIAPLSAWGRSTLQDIGACPVEAIHPYSDRPDGVGYPGSAQLDCAGRVYVGGICDLRDIV